MPHAPGHVINLRANLALRTDHDLGCRRWRWRAQIGHEVADGEIGLVADRGDRRDGAGRDGARDRFLVERPEIFERSSAAADEDDVVQLPAREVPDRDRDLSRGISALHADRINLHLQPLEAAPENVEDVANRSAGRAGDDGDPLRQHRNRLLSRRIEQSFIGELLLELLECQLQCAEAGRLDGDSVELELPLLFVKREASADDELQSVFDAEAEETCVRREQHHAHLGPRILDRKIDMTGSGTDDVRRFALDAYVVVSKELDVDLPDELTYFPDALGHGAHVIQINSGKLVALP